MSQQKTLRSFFSSKSRVSDEAEGKHITQSVQTKNKFQCAGQTNFLETDEPVTAADQAQ